MAPEFMLGTSSFGQFERACSVYDQFWSLGGRAFDTAWNYGYAYGPGCCERVLGEWLRTRGVGDEAFVLAKGAHTPECFPERIADQLHTSLDRLGLARVDLYMLHRDNTDVPVGEFVDAMHNLVRSGYIAGYGVSNWSLDRVCEAEEYARNHGLPPPAGVSNHYSLAEMIEPIYPGTVSARSSDWETHLAQRTIRLYPWASQGRGIFALRGEPAFRESPLAEHWYSERNVERLRRTRRLAEQHDVSPTVIALTWLLRQNLAVTPIVGPRTVEEVVDTYRARELTLSPRELQWLGGDR